MLRSIAFFSLFLAPALFVAGLSAAYAVDSADGRASALLPVERLIRVPMTRQATDYTCGVAALQSVLGYYGLEIREDNLSKDLKADPNEGTSYKQIADFARSQGFTVEIKTGLTLDDLKRQLDRKRPVICLIQAWPEKKVDFEKDWDDGHYVVAVGYDRSNVYFMDPSTLGNYTYIPAREFLKRWHDTDTHEKVVHFGMTISKPRPSYSPTAIRPLK